MAESNLRRFVSAMTSKLPADKVEKAKALAINSGREVRTGAEALVTGGLLGIAHAELPTGLDIHVGKGKGATSIPLDAVFGVCAKVGAAAFHADGYAPDLSTIGNVALGTYGFRTTMNLLAAKKASVGHTVNGKVGAPPTPPAVSVAPPATAVHGEWPQSEYTHYNGDVGEDPVVAFARTL